MNKINKNRAKKEKIVAEIADKVARAQALVFANYQGMTHKQLEELKKAIKGADAELSVTKNTLLALALQNSKFKIQSSKTEGPTATIFAYSDVIAPLKHLARVIKTLSLPTIKFGIMDGKELTADEVLKLSALPSREVLLTQLVFSLKSPIFGLHRALS